MSENPTIIPTTIKAPVRFEYRLTRPNGEWLARGSEDMHLTVKSDDLSSDAAARAVSETLIAAAHELIRVCESDDFEEIE